MTESNSPELIWRRDIVGNAALCGAALAMAPVLNWLDSAPTKQFQQNGAASRTLPFDRDWLFDGKLKPSTRVTDVDERTFSPVTLPHCVRKLSWENPGQSRNRSSDCKGGC